MALPPMKLRLAAVPLPSLGMTPVETEIFGESAPL
jgi:hypothetical protein